MALLEQENFNGETGPVLIENRLTSLNGNSWGKINAWQIDVNDLLANKATSESTTSGNKFPYAEIVLDPGTTDYIWEGQCRANNNTHTSTACAVTARIVSQGVGISAALFGGANGARGVALYKGVTKQGTDYLVDWANDTEYGIRLIVRDSATINEIDCEVWVDEGSGYVKRITQTITDSTIYGNNGRVGIRAVLNGTSNCGWDDLELNDFKIALSGTSTSSGAVSLQKEIAKALSGVSSNAGALTLDVQTLIRKTLTGLSTNAGVLVRTVSKQISLSGSSSNVGALSRKIVKQLIGASSSSGTVATSVVFDAKWSIEHLEASTSHGFPAVYVEVSNQTQPTGAFPTGTVYERKLLEIPRLQEVQLDSRFGVSGFQRVTLQVDNSGGALNSVDIQDAFVRMFFVDADGNIYKEFKGKVVDWTLSHTATINVEDIDALAFTEELPKRTLNDLVEAEKAADGTFANVVVADDLGKPIPIIFGRNVKVPLLYVKADETNREYDYIIGEGVGLNSNNFQEVFTAYRNEQALDSIEGTMAAATSTTLTLETADERPDSWYKYWWAEMLTGNAAGQITDVTAYDSATNKLTVTAWGVTPTSGTYRLREWRFYGGSQVSPYAGYSFIRFKKRLGTVGRTDNLYADVNGFQDEVNRARAVESILSNASWGLGLTVDSASFTTAASAMTAISGLTCEGAILSQTTAIDIFTKLLSFRDMVLSKDDSIKISVDAAKTSTFNFGLGDETGYSNILNASPAINYVHPDQKVKDLKVRYRKNYKENDTYLHEFTRSSSANGVDDTLDLPFVYDHTTADNALDYKRKRLATAIKNLSLDIGQDGGNAKRGDLVTVDIPSLGVSSDWEVVGSNVTPAGSNSLSLVPYSATPYAYTSFTSEGGTLPVDESFDITPDYSTTLPDPVSSVIVTAGFTTQPNSKVGFMDVSWTPPNDGNYSGAEVLIKVNGEPASSYITVGTGFENFRVNTVEIGESYDVLVTSLNITGELKGIGTEDLNTLIPGDTTNPNAPTGLSFVGSMLGELTWEFTASTSTDVQKYEYQIDDASSFSTPVFSGEVVDLQIKYSGDLSGGLASGVTRWARVRTVDKSGNTSAWTTGVSGVTAGVNSGDIGNDQINSQHYANLSIDSAHIGDAQITEAKIANLAVTEAKIQNAAIKTAKIDDLQVVNLKIGDSSIDEDKRITVFSDTFDTGGTFTLNANTKSTFSNTEVHNLGEKTITVTQMSFNTAFTNGTVDTVYIETNSTTQTKVQFEICNTGNIGTLNNVTAGGEVYYW